MINPLVIRSKDLITSSLLDYMRYRDFCDIKITEIVNKAQISRKTFYRHFHSKVDVLEKKMESIFEEYLLKSEKNYSYEEATLMFFNLVKKHRTFFTLIYENKLSDILIKKLEFFLSIMNKTPKYKQLEPAVISYCEMISAVSLSKIAHKWIDSGLKESCKEINYIYLSLSK